MTNKTLIKLIFSIYFILFYLSCDDRQPSESEDAAAITASELQVYGNPVVNVVNLEESIEVPFYALPLDDNGVFVSGVSISFEMLDGSPGYLSEATLTTDSSAVEQNFNIVPLSHLDTSGTFNFENTSTVRAYLESKPSISDTMYFVFEDGGLVADNEVLSDIIVENDSISIDEQTLISVELTGNINGESDIPIQDKWIHFESLMPDDTDGTMEFGEMSPEYSQTNEFGIAQSTFKPLNQTGFVKLKVSREDLNQETFMQVSSGEGISLELIIPSDNTLMVTGGGGNESVTISAEIKDGFGNYVSDEYDVIFSIPCPFPLDGSCPNGDGDYSNDIMLNGTPSEGGNPMAVSRSVNGIANVTLNSGNRPGLVLIKAQLCSTEDSENGTCPIDEQEEPNNQDHKVIYQAERVAAAISTGPANYGQVVAGWTEADSTGGGVYSLPVTATFWDKWTNPISDSTSVYWYINPEYIASVDPESKVGNCGQNEPGQACTDAFYTSGDIFSQGQICAKVAGEGGSDVLACSGGARCEDFTEFNCLESEDSGCVWNEEFEECYFIASEAFCNTIYEFSSQCDPSHENYLGYPAPYNCVWEPGAIAAIPEWQAQINDGASCHYAPLINGLDEQQFSFDADGDGFDDLFTGEWEAVGTVAPDDPFCNIGGMNYLQYQEYSDECEGNSICSWEFIAGDATSEDGSIGTCVYNGGSGYYNPCVDCQIEIIPLSPTVTDYCQTNDQPLDILVRGHLGDAYGDDVHLGSLLMAVFDATAFNFISSDDTTIDEDMGYEFDPPIPASATQITDSNGEVYWIVRLPNDNCHNTNPDDPDVFSCDNVFFRAFLLDPLYGESIDLNTTLFKNCQP